MGEVWGNDSNGTMKSGSMLKWLKFKPLRLKTGQTVLAIRSEGLIESDMAAFFMDHGDLSRLQLA